MGKGRYIAIRHNGTAMILEGEYGGHYQYADRDFHGLRPLLKERYDALPVEDATYTRRTLKTLHVHGPAGRFRMFVPDDWPDKQSELFIQREQGIMRLAPALDDPHQIDRSRQMERLYHGS